MAIARGVSHGSRTFLGEDDPANGPEAQALRRYATGVVERDEADVVLCGHAHAPELTPVSASGQSGLYINTGDWLAHRSHTIWDGAHFTQYARGREPVTSG